MAQVPQQKLSWRWRWRCFWLLLSCLLAFLLLSFSLSRPLPPVLPLHTPRFLQVPQISWGLNNQKIALARAALTARFLNRSLVLPSLSSSLSYKDPSLLHPLPFDHLFSLPRFNSLCHGFVSIAPLHLLPPATVALNVSKGSGRRWTKERDLQQLLECREREIERHSLLRFVGKNPFLWHDHWPVRDYARVFQCLVLVDELSAQADRIVSRLRQTSLRLPIVPATSLATQIDGESLESNFKMSDAESQMVDEYAEYNGYNHSRYLSVHLRIEKDWMIHCKKTEDRARTRKGKSLNICSSKQEIIESVSHIPHLHKPSLVYLAVADVLLEDRTLLEGWTDGLIPFEKKRLGVLHLYGKYAYLLQSAIDYEVCLRADIFVGNSFSTFSSLIVLERTLKMLQTQSSDVCGTSYPSYAYNLRNANGSPQLWVTNLSDVSLQSISYGTDRVSCFY